MRAAARLAFEEVACLRGDRLLFEGLSFALTPGEAALVTAPWRHPGPAQSRRVIVVLAKGLKPPARSESMRISQASRSRS